MRFLFSFILLGFAACAGAAGLTGTFSIQAETGVFVASLEERGSSLIGNIDLAGRGLLQLAGTVNGNRGRGTINASDGKATFEAEVDGDVLTLVISQPDGPRQRAGRGSFQFQRVEASSARQSPIAAVPGGSSAGGESKLVGNWVHQSLITSGSASMASEEFLSFRADGAYAYGKGRSVAGGANWSYDGGRGQGGENGRWRASDGVLFMLDENGQWFRVGKYGFTEDLRTMRITYDRGGKKLWSRR